MSNVYDMQSFKISKLHIIDGRSGIKKTIYDKKNIKSLINRISKTNIRRKYFRSSGYTYAATAFDENDGQLFTVFDNREIYFGNKGYQFNDFKFNFEELFNTIK